LIYPSVNCFEIDKGFVEVKRSEVWRFGVQ